MQNERFINILIPNYVLPATNFFPLLRHLWGKHIQLHFKMPWGQAWVLGILLTKAEPFCITTYFEILFIKWLQSYHINYLLILVFLWPPPHSHLSEVWSSRANHLPTWGGLHVEDQEKNLQSQQLPESFIDICVHSSWWFLLSVLVSQAF